jgi:CRISPR-associated protein Cmr4
MDKGIIVGFLAETELHPGAGQGLGAIDQPVQREGGSHLPAVPGSSYKGAAKSAIVGGDESDDRMRFFGRPRNSATATEDRPGTVAFGDIRLLLLPMRCSVSAYKWVTTRYLLERFCRDAQRIEYPISPNLWPRLNPPGTDEVYTDAPGEGGKLHIEELLFTSRGRSNAHCEVVQCLQNLVPTEAPYNKLRDTRLGEQLLIMNDDDFTWFCQYALPVRPHNQLNPKTKASENFWYEEYLPADTLMYAVNAARAADKGDVAAYADELRKRPWLQFGGNETTGEGVCRVKVWD